MLAAATALFALVASASAQALPSSAASPEQLALVDAQYNASGFPDSGAILTVSYASFVVQNGNAYTAEQVATAPTIYVTPSTTTRDEFNSSSVYTVMLADASSLGDPDTEGNYRRVLQRSTHYLVNGQTGTSTGSNYTFEPSGGT
ncbi:SPOSA6832_03347, partial [Sporobolomyces salmonicolor]